MNPILIVFLPLLSFCLSIIFGRYLGSRGVSILTILIIFLVFIFSLINLNAESLNPSGTGLVRVSLFPWINTCYFFTNWTFTFDTLANIMLVVVTFISMLVHIYSVSYMYYDPHLIRFLSYLSLFTFFMLMLVTSGNFLQLFLGWEGVGLASYLLINFWFTRLQANKSAIKAVIVNKFGDFALLLAIVLIYNVFDTLDFGQINALITSSDIVYFKETGYWFSKSLFEFWCFSEAYKLYWVNTILPLTNQWFIVESDWLNLKVFMHQWFFLSVPETSLTISESFMYKYIDLCKTLDLSVAPTVEGNIMYDFRPFLNVVIFSDLWYFWLNVSTFQLIGILLLLAAVGKSAQLGLHTWLPDAMEGPTPVSALIHAATMVTAGVFLLVRCSPIIEYSEFTVFFIMLFGGLTAFFAGLVGLVQNDLKRVIAYSTCSQLGYMVYSCGMSNYSLAMFHLSNHAFFKALLFLCAGSVIHGLGNEQDMRRMGGLVLSLPLTYILVCIGSLALMGFPFLTGFYSKDVILETMTEIYTIEGYFLYWLGLMAAFCTAFYSTRLLYLTFIKIPSESQKVYQMSHESDIFITFPIIILGVCSLFIGYVTKDLFIGLGTPFWVNSIFFGINATPFLDSEFIPSNIKLLPLGLSVISSFIAFFIYTYFFNILNLFKYNKIFFIIYKFLSKKWFFDLIYNHYLVQNFLKFGYNIGFKLIDQGIIQYFGAKGLILTFSNSSHFVRRVHPGSIYYYIIHIIFGASFFLVYFYLPF